MFRNFVGSIQCEKDGQLLGCILVHRSERGAKSNRVVGKDLEIDPLPCNVENFSG